MSIKSNFIDCFNKDRLGSIDTSGKIPKLSPDLSYSTGNFSVLREKHSELQLDSVNGTKHRLETILSRTNWAPSFFKDKLILECGCGAGPDTEVLLSLGAKVMSVDIAGLEIASKNIGDNSNSQFLQASLLDLPFKENNFDIVYCHRVIQHTPNPDRYLRNILRYVKPSGHVFIHSYAKTWTQMVRWKYLLRPLTTNMSPSVLYHRIERHSSFLYNLCNKLEKIGKFGKTIKRIFVPFFNYRNNDFFKEKSDKWIIQYGIHDTFDALSPKFDNPLSCKRFRKIAEDILTPKNINWSILDGAGITLLRS
tara:strand:+ start:14289 stop:15212 length:924 start_codon:yes stop_codon:yes gene_type:complete